ncbi:MAG: BrnT family toxin [Candidatus Omnitrophota bacterium]|nr:BrnT family toxin [Candidatus Omnitrophota bacterium]
MLNSNQGNKRQNSFVWDLSRELTNIHKHGIDFFTAAQAFKDPKRKIYADSRHSIEEERLFCIGKVGNRIITVRFTYRGLLRNAIFSVILIPKDEESRR